MSPHAKRILILADIEGSSGCWSYKSSSFLTREWAGACAAMTTDVEAVVSALFEAGADRVTVKDFHRTGFNLLPERIDARAKVVSGYLRSPVPGIGDPSGHDLLMLVGMHAASGSPGFLSHTLTSRIDSLELNGRLIGEIELFAGAVAPWGLRPVFFSGCPLACAQAEAVVPGIRTFAINKSKNPAAFDDAAFRRGLAGAAVESLAEPETVPYQPDGPLRVVMTMRNGAPAAAALSRRWGLNQDGSRILLDARNFPELYARLVRICYLTPWTAKILPISLFLYNLRGRLGLQWARRIIKRYKV